MAFEVVPPPSFTVGLKPGSAQTPRLSWAPYSAADRAGHSLLGYRVYRSLVAGPIGSLIADENVLGPSSTFYDDESAPEATTVYYTVVSVEVIGYGVRPYGEGGNVPYGV